jgi:hypothetical protein
VRRKSIIPNELTINLKRNKGDILSLIAAYVEDFSGFT